MTGKLGVTAVPLPSFWSSSSAATSGERRKAHPCQNPRCAASKPSCILTHQDPPAKKRRQSAKKANAVPSISSYGTPTASERSAGTKGRSSDAEESLDCNGACDPRRALKPLVLSSPRNSCRGSTGRNSKGSTSPIFSSYPPSVYVSSPTRSPANLSRGDLAPLSPQNRNLSTGRFTPDGGSGGPSQITANFPPPAESQRTFVGDEFPTVSSPQAGSVAPRNSESGEGDEVVGGGQTSPPATNSTPKVPYALPAHDLIPLRPAASSPRHTRLGRRAPGSDQMATLRSSQSPGLTAAALPTQGKTIGSREISETCSPFLPEVSKVAEARHGHSKGQEAHGKTSLASTKSKSGSRGSPTIATMATMATVGNAAHVSVMEQRIEEEDCKSESSQRIAIPSVRSEELCSTEWEHTSGFCDTLSAQTCTFCGNETFGEQDLSKHRHHRKDRRMVMAKEIAVISVLVALLVFTFYSVFLSGSRSPWHGCCACRSFAGNSVSTTRNPGQHYSQLRVDNGWVHRGLRNLLKCPMPRQEVGWTVLR